MKKIIVCISIPSAHFPFCSLNTIESGTHAPELQQRKKAAWKIDREASYELAWLGAQEWRNRQNLLLRFEESNEIGTLFRFLQACKHHFGSRNIFLRIQQISKEMLLIPLNTRLRVGFGVCVAICSTGIAADNSMQIRSLLVRSAGFRHVALRTLRLENLGTALSAAFRDLGYLSSFRTSRHI